MRTAAPGRPSRTVKDEPMNRPAFSRRPLLLGLAAVGVAFALPLRRIQASPPLLRVAKVTGCGCCEGWADHLRASGFACEVAAYDDLAPIKRRLGVPEDLESCHTATLEGYVVEGHVPAAALRRLLAERPGIAGLAVPGMPMGSPGMPSPRPEAYEVIAFAAGGRREVFMRFVGEEAA
jgi:hypothetical protein